MVVSLNARIAGWSERIVALIITPAQTVDHRFAFTILTHTMSIDVVQIAAVVER
jgi:hypothetical protein